LPLQRARFDQQNLGYYGVAVAIGLIAAHYPRDRCVKNTPWWKVVGTQPIKRFVIGSCRGVGLSGPRTPYAANKWEIGALLFRGKSRAKLPQAEGRVRKNCANH
jgi:hypothetical protein